MCSHMKHLFVRGGVNKSRIEISSSERGSYFVPHMNSGNEYLSSAGSRVQVAQMDVVEIT